MHPKHRRCRSHRTRGSSSALARLLFLVVGLFGLGAAQPEPAAGQDDAPAAPVPASNTWYATTFVRASGVGIREIHYWSKGPWMRAETVMNGHRLVTIVRGSEYISYDVVTGQGARIQRAPQAIADEAGRLRPFGNDLDEVRRQGAEKVEETIGGGQRGEVWRVTDEAGRRKLTVTRDAPQLPISLETYVRANGQTVSLDYMNWARGLTLPDGFFEPPSEMQLERLDYATYVAQATQRPIGPVLYPDALHGIGGR